MSDGTGGASQAAAAGAGAAKTMLVEGETLSAFKRRVDALLRDLEKSKAAPKSIANGAMPSGRLGAFEEADGLHSAYTKVHSQLANLSKMLALQIEGLVVTVDATKTGYDNLDEDVRARLSRIRSQADALVNRGGKATHGSHHNGADTAAGGEPVPKAAEDEAGGL
ncbi:hypothetical protein [Streptomyces sp. NPDC050264]|uniref:hypothetical protein n=1 Tax=Streptomyces sp. NPDC050264 TaxID=3155038 RepID=UPI00341E7F16